MSTAERDLFKTQVQPLEQNPSRQLMTMTGSPSPASEMRQTQASTTAPLAPPGGAAPAKPAQVSTSTTRELFSTTAAPAPGPTTPATPGAQTNVQPAAKVPTAPVVAAPVVSQVQSNETVSGQLRELLGADSPILKQARDRAQVYAASRGMQNSTLAAQAGEEAVISTAAPIAAADAATHATRALSNQNAQNQFGLQQQQIEGTSRLQAESSLQRLAEQAQQGDINSRLQLEQAGYDFNLSVQENIHKLQQLAAQGDVEAKLALQKFGFDTALQEQQGNIQARLQTEQHMQRLIEQAQAGDINSRLQLEQHGWNMQLSAQENLQRLEQLAAEGDIQSALALQQFNYQTMLENQRQGHALELGDKAFQQNQQLLMTEYQQRGILSTQEAAQEIARLNQLHQNTLAEIAAQAAGASTAEADSAKWSRDLQAAYLNAVTQRQMAASQEIQTIYSTQGLTSAQQTAAVQNARARLQNDIDAMAAYFQQTPGWPTPNPSGGVGGPGSTPGGAVNPGGMPPSSIPYTPPAGLYPGERDFEVPIGPPIVAGGSLGPKRGRRQPV